MEENLTIFVVGVMFLGLYYGYIVGKSVDQRFSKHKWVSKIMNGFFVIAFVLLAATNIEIFASAEESQFEFFIPHDLDSAGYLIMDLFKLSNGNAGILHLFSIIITIPIIFSIRGSNKDTIKKIGLISGLFLMLVTLTPYVPSENMSVLYATFQFSSIFGILAGIDREGRYSLERIVRLMLGESVASK